MINWQIGVTLDEVEKQVILAALQFFHGNKTKAAEALGITSRTIQNKLNFYNGVKNEPEEDNTESNSQDGPERSLSMRKHKKV
jgi:DNA-binding NtrC family response regulator